MRAILYLLSLAVLQSSGHAVLTFEQDDALKTDKKTIWEVEREARRTEGTGAPLKDAQ